MTALPIDVLKAEFPADAASINDDEILLGACRSLNAASTKPWVILSAGADYKIFRREVELACQAGASGFLAGRAIWQEAIPMTEKADRIQFLERVASGRLKEISLIAETCGRPWYQKLGLAPDRLAVVDEWWHTKYLLS
jgi:tagatose 1,6-diphosphate aldolase